MVGTNYDHFGSRFDTEWANKKWEEDPERFTVDRPTDPAHGDDSKAPAPLMQDAPTLPAGGEIYTDATFYGRVAEPMVIDSTPANGNGNPQSVGHGVGGLTTPGASPGELGYFRGMDYGAARRGTISNVIYRFFNDDYFTVMPKSEEPPPLNRMANNPQFIRGANAYPANDGVGRPWSWSVSPGATWHRGENYDVSNVQRGWFHAPSLQRNSVKVAEPDQTTIIIDAPPPDKWDAYASPFSFIQKFMPKRRRVRGIRRDPGPWDEDLQAQDIQPAYAPSVDGLVVR